MRLLIEFINFLSVLLIRMHSQMDGFKGRKNASILLIKQYFSRFFSTDCWKCDPLVFIKNNIHAICGILFLTHARNHTFDIDTFFHKADRDWFIRYRCRFLRNKDRDLHQNCYPKLYYPEMYILEGGYKEFFAQKQVSVFFVIMDVVFCL